jgi:hypothetical protein
MAIANRSQLIEKLALIGVMGLARNGDLDKLFAAPGSTDISDATAVGKSVLTAVDATAARTAIGAGTSSLAIGTTASTAKIGTYVPTTAEVGTALKTKTQIAALANTANADATDLPTALTLVNALKANLNLIIASLKA